jgi:hypothetical protein
VGILHDGRKIKKGLVCAVIDIYDMLVGFFYLGALTAISMFMGYVVGIIRYLVYGKVGD